MTTTKVRKKTLRQGVSEKINAKKTEISMDIKFSVETIKGWIYRRPHKLDYPFVLKAIKKHTGLTREQIFENDSE